MGDEPDCAVVIHNLTSHVEKCLYVLNNSDCQSTGFFQYSSFVYCFMPDSLQWLGVLVLVTLLIVLFLGLSTAADSFFCPSLAVIVEHLSLSHNIAGVTFLAFGNGAPDIFASLASVLNSDNPSAGLAFGALLGAGMFLSTIIVGAVTLIKPFPVMQRPLLRDLVFYLFTVYWTFYILYTGRIRLLDALGFLMLYVVYVIVVVVGRFIRKRMQARAREEAQRRLGTPMDGQDFPASKNNNDEGSSSQQQAEADDEEAMKYDLFFAHGHARSTPSNDFQSVNDDLFAVDSVSIAGSDYGLTVGVKKPFGWMAELKASLAPCDAEEWREARWYSRALIVLRAPVLILLTLTVPVVDLSKANHNWSYVMAIVHACICPLFALVALQYINYLIGGVFPLALLVLGVGVAIGVFVAVTCRPGRPPKYHRFVAYMGFLMAVIWIYSLAREVVNVLQTFGIVLNLSHEILGLTVLAWSNSLGDLISDITVATQGYPRMAISACFGGPLFNILVGVGLPFTIASLREGGRDLEVVTSPVAQILCIALAISLITSFLVIPLSKFKATRPYAVFLLFLYIAFLVVAILTESKIIHRIW